MRKASGSRFRSTGLQETQALLSAATKDLKKTTKDLGAAIEPITAQYNDLAVQSRTASRRN